MTSRFFAADSDTESESESSSQEEVAQQPNAAAQFGAYDSSDSEEEKRVVRSEKDKRWEELQATCGLIKNHLKINDWVAINSDYDLLMKQLAKAKSVVTTHGVPKFLIKAVLNIENAIKAQDPKKTGKKMSASNAKGVNTMRQKLRKHNKTYERQIEAYLADPLLSDEEKASTSDSGSDSEEESKKKPVAKKATKKAEKESGSDDSGSDSGSGSGSGSGSDEDDDSESWDETESDEESDEEDGDDVCRDMFKREFWVKRVKAGDSEQKAMEIDEFVKRVKPTYPGWEADIEEARKDAKDAPMYVDKALRKIEMQQRKHLGEETAGKKEKEPAAPAKKAEEKIKNYTPEVIAKKLRELQAARGKRGTDRAQVVEDLKLLATKATSAVVMLKVKTTLTAALFDSTLNTVKYMPRATWQDLVQTLMDILDVLEKNPNVRLSEDEEVKDAFEDEDESTMSLERLMEEEEARAKRLEEKAKKDEEERAKAAAEGRQTIDYVHGNLYAVVQRVVNEFRSSLQHIDPHTPEYVTRLRDEKLTVDLVKKTQAYYKQIEKPHLERTVALLRLEIIYYHYDPKLDVQGELKGHPVTLAKASLGCFPAPMKDSEGNVSEVHNLALYLYKSPDAREKMRALLCHVYHLALHNRCADARNLLLMSHAADTINDADIRTRIMFNRSMAQMGLCYFRLGDVRQALDCLSELYQSNRFKELLAQGISSTRYGAERDLEKEKLERRRQYPYHMHINLDLLESVHLMSAMFLEVPNLAAFGTEYQALRRNKRKVISKTFRRLLEHSSSKAFNGPPENTRDSIMAATKSMQKGDWEGAMEHIERLKMWNLMKNSDVVKDMIKTKVKEVTLKTYLLTYGPQYTSISLESLVTMFEMESKDVFRIVSRMIFNDQLQGAWDQQTLCVIMQSHKATQLQAACIAYADKAGQFVEQNEKLLEQRFGFYTNKNFGDKKWGGGGGGNGGGGGGYQGNRGSRDNQNKIENKPTDFSRQQRDNSQNFGNFRKDSRGGDRR